MENNRLHIRCFRAQYLVAGDHAAPETVRARVDEAIEPHHLAPALSSALTPWFSETDPSVWLIRRLEMNVDLDAASERDQLTRVIVAQIARTVGASLQDEQNSENVLRFPNRAAYLSRFLSDLAAGAAWSRWYYESFAGLRQLSTSAALRTAICDQPETGREALLQLRDYELKDVLRVLGSQDARRILDGLTENDTAGSEFQCCEAAWAVWRVTEADSFASSDASRQLLHLYLAARRSQPDVGGLPLKRAAAALLRLASRLVADSPGQRQQLIASLAAGEAASVNETAGDDADALMPLLRCPPEWVREVSEALLGQPMAAASETAATEGRRHTSFGGVFLLLPLLDDLPLVAATRGWSHADEAAAITLVRFLLLIKCCGQMHAQRAFYDPLLRDLLLIPPGVSPSVIREWSSSITAAQVQSFLETLIDWQRSRGAIHDKEQILARAGLGADSVVILIDGARGHWLTVERHTRRARKLIPALRNLLSELESHDGLLLCESSLLAALWSEFPNVRMISLEDERAQRSADEENQTAGILTRLDTLTGDLSYLALSDSFQLARGLDRALSVAAQNLLRNFAWRLPGFAASSLPYLSANFLDFPGSAEEEPERRVVRLGRPLLHLVSSLTGMSRQTYRLSWLDERPLWLFPED
jgi:hypothetical protein